MTWTTMELLPLVCLCVLTWSGSTSADVNGPDVVKVVVKEGEDAILPCSLSTKENIEFKRFDWKKDGQKKVFMYDAGFTYDNGLPGQDEQFKQRVFHFPDQLEVGNASIVIKQTKVTDRGNYTCIFSHLQPPRRFHIILVVGPDVVKVKEGEDAILPCSLSTKENIESKLFDWKKDGQKEVFFYDAGVTYEGLPGQEAQFRGRVFHFPDQLKVGNASIVIKQTKVTDSGNYTCDFPRLQPPRRFHIELVVGAVSKPSIKTLEQTEHIAVLQCEVQGAFPKPQLQWQDRGGNIVPAEKPQVTERGGRYDVILNTTVTKTDHYRCVVTQEEINHQVYSETYVYICGAAPEPTVTALKVTKHNAVLQCKVRGAFTKPQLQWQDSTGNIVPAEKPQVTERGGRYNVILQTTVTKTDHYRCVVTQEEINHQVYSDIIEYVGGSGSHTGVVVGLVVGLVVVLVVIGAALYIRWYKKRKDKKEAREEDYQPVKISQ